MASRHADVHHVYPEGQVYQPVTLETPECFLKATAHELLYRREGAYPGAPINTRAIGHRTSGRPGLAARVPARTGDPGGGHP